jgi:hypothetical protein
MTEKLYTRCLYCDGKGCVICNQQGYMATGLNLGQVDRMIDDLKRAVFPGWQSHEQWVANGRAVPEKKAMSE